MNKYGIKVIHENPNFASNTCGEILIKIKKNTDLRVSKKAKPYSDGTKSTSFSLYELVLGAVTSGAIPSLIEIINSYIQQDKKLEFELTNDKGASFKIKSSNLKSSEREQLISDARKFMDCL